MENKRTYTVPVLLLIIVVLTTLIVMVYSKLLIAEQQRTTDEGKRLAEQYTFANVFTERLSEGAALLERPDAADAEKLHGKRLLGEASFPALQTVAILTEAAHRTSGQSNEEAFKPISIDMSKLSDKLNGIAEHDGAITADERRVLAAVHEGTARMADALHRFRPPTGEAGFRQMTAGGDWVAAANDAAKALKDMASKLK